MGSTADYVNNAEIWLLINGIFERIYLGCSSYLLGIEQQPGNILLLVVI